MPKLIDLVDQRFGRLLVTSHVNDKNHGHHKWLCQCDCGRTHVVLGLNLKRGLTRSCGCLRSEASAQRRTTHGLRQRPEYIVWVGMRNRCYNRTDRSFKDYGGRGISVCDEWRNDFGAFFRDMGERPSQLHSIERTKNHLGYCKDNCEWALPQQQANNRRSNRLIRYRGKRVTIRQAMILAGTTLSFRTICARIVTAGWPVNLALTAPLNHRHR